MGKFWLRKLQFFHLTFEGKKEMKSIIKDLMNSNIKLKMKQFR